MWNAGYSFGKAQSLQTALRIRWPIGHKCIESVPCDKSSAVMRCRVFAWLTSIVQAQVRSAGAVTVRFSVQR